MLIAQLSDIHLRGGRARPVSDHIDPGARLEAALGRLTSLAPRPDAVVITGDLTEHGSACEYEALGRQLARFEIPTFLGVGNHDSRQTLVATLQVDHLCGPTPFVQYVIDHLPVRLIVLDSTTPQHPHGEFCEERLAWLERKVAKAPDRPTVLALHHPPFETGLAAMDGPGAAWASGLVELVSRSPNIVRILCGHAHRSVQATVGGRPASVCPSLAPAVRLDLTPGKALATAGASEDFFELEPAAFQLHLWDQGRWVTHTLFVERYPQVAAEAA